MVADILSRKLLQKKDTDILNGKKRGNDGYKLIPITKEM